MTSDHKIDCLLNYSQNLFKTEENGPLVFSVSPSADSDYLIKLIKNGGGEVVFADQPEVIRIVSRNGYSKNEKNVSASFIYASCLENKLLDINSFRIQSEQFSASSVFLSLAEGVEKLFETLKKDRLVKIIMHISKSDNLWKAMADSKEFEGSSMTEIRNAFCIWSFIHLKCGQKRGEKVLGDLLSIVKNVAEECCGYGNKIESIERDLKSARNSPRACKKTTVERGMNMDDNERQQTENLSQRMCDAESVGVSTSDISTDEDLQEAVISKEGDSQAQVTEGCDKVCNTNGVDSEECVSENDMEVVDLVCEKDVVESCCTEGRTEEGNVEESNVAGVQESNGLKEKSSLKEGDMKEKVKLECVKSGVWLGKNSMKPERSLREEREEEEETEESSSESEDLTSEPEEKIPKFSRKLPGNKYRYNEDLIIIKWVLKTRNSNWSIQGNRIWMYFEKKKILPNRSWQSMKERFKRHISTSLNKYSLSNEDLKKLKRIL